jgi:phage terminase small subunit
MAKRLTTRQALFVEAYLGLARGNATEAARLAGYQGSANTLQKTGYETLRAPAVAEAIAARLAELKAAMSADEVLEVLSDQARGSMGDFLSIDESGRARLDLAKAERLGKLHLIKSFTTTKKTTKIELYDAQKAGIQMGRYHRLFVDRVEHEVDPRSELAKLLGVPEDELAPGGDDAAQP